MKYAVLNLDNKFDPISDYSLERLTSKSFDFLGGEPHFQIQNKPEFTDGVIITQRVNSAADFFKIVLANDAARRMGFKAQRLVIPYFPAARQDRVCNVGEPLTVKVFADLINNCGFEKVTILGPHSEVTPALLNNVEVIDNDAGFAMSAFANLGSMTQTSNPHHVFNVICPDAGAGKRVGKIAELIQKRLGGWARVNLIRCEKVRDVKTGELKEFFVASQDLEGAISIIFDDVVAKGGTFLGLAKVLRERNCGPLGIFTYHADCQEGLDNLASVFDGVFTTNSKRDYPETDKIKLLPFDV